jgi:hypothetical protein
MATVRSAVPAQRLSPDGRAVDLSTERDATEIEATSIKWIPHFWEIISFIEKEMAKNVIREAIREAIPYTRPISSLDNA